MSTPPHGISRVFDGVVIRKNSVLILTHYPLELVGEGAHRLALRCLYGEWPRLQLGPVWDLLDGKTEVATITAVFRSSDSGADPLGCAIRWQPPTDYFLIEAKTATWILKASSFQELVFGADGKYHLFIRGLCFELTLHPRDYGSMRGRILSLLPIDRPAMPEDMTGFTRWKKPDYASSLVRDRFEFSEIKLLSEGEIADAFSSRPGIGHGPGISKVPPLSPPSSHQIGEL